VIQAVAVKIDDIQTAVTPTAKTQYVVDASEHLGLVRQIAAKYCPRGTPIEDTDEYADGILGLLRACEKYDPEQELFSTFAWKSIQTAIIQGWRKKNRKKRTGIVGSLENDPMDCHTDLSKVGQLISVLLEPQAGDDESAFRCKTILYDHFINEKTWAEIGRDNNLTRERVRQLGNEAIQLIRRQFKIEEFDTLEELLNFDLD
jgi:DNA-directed RNA polymerase sigma subunit (sigma70/sigma32)